MHSRPWREIRDMQWPKWCWWCSSLSWDEEGRILWGQTFEGCLCGRSPPPYLLLVTATRRQTKIDFLKVFTHYLARGIIDKDIKSAICFHVLLDDFIHAFEVGEIEWDGQTFPSLFLNYLFRFVSILLFLRQVDDCDISAFASVKNGNRASNPRAVISTQPKRRLLSPCDYSFLALQFVWAFIFD